MVLIITIVILAALYLLYRICMPMIHQRCDDKQSCCGSHPMQDVWVKPRDVAKQVEAPVSAANQSDEYAPVDEKMPVVVEEAKPSTRPVVNQNQIETDRILKIAHKTETNRFVSDDEIRFRAYMIAQADDFKGDAKQYWIQAEKELRS